MPPHTPTPMYMHKCIHTVLVNILQYANEYTHPTNLVYLGGEGHAGMGREEGKGQEGKGKRGGAGGGRKEGEEGEEPEEKRCHTQQ